VTGSEWQDWTAANDDSTDEWATPPCLWKSFSNALDGFDLDPASGCEPVQIADETYTEEDDGLSQNWFGTVWCNPPYSNPGAWLEKAISEHCTKQNTDTILLLLPARTNTNWFSNNIENADAVLFFDSKISFLKDGRSEKDALPSPVMLVVFGDLDDSLIKTCHEKGWLVSVDEQTIRLDEF